MGSVIATATRRRASRKFSQYGYERRIKNWNKENQNRHREHRNDTARASAGNVHQRGTGQEESDEHRPAIAHEDRRRMRVVNQKAEQRSREDRHHKSFGRLVVGYKAQSQET